MAHKQQKQFCKLVKELYPNHFRNVSVVDVGSLDINGNNRYLFKNSHYKGIDLKAGKNVDFVGLAHQCLPAVEIMLKGLLRQAFKNQITDETRIFDTIISTEALEHDEHFSYTLNVMYTHLKSGGLLLITAAGEGRPEHGTTNNYPDASPGTNDYYCNVTNEMFIGVLNPLLFTDFFIRQDKSNNDFQFFGIKK
jgi:hypothetical protein